MKRILALVSILVGCRDATSKQPAVAPGSAAPLAAGSAAPAGTPPPPQAKPLDDDEPAHVQDENKQGMNRFKDTVVYLDGKPIAFLMFGELPLSLKPTWRKTKKSIEKEASCTTCLPWAWTQERYYKFTDYLKSLGVPIAKIRQLHVQGPKPTDTIVASAKDLLSPAADQFLFHFGSITSGKAIPRVPLNFGNGQGPDKITAVMIYIAKTPPTFDTDGYVLDGQPIDGVPYFGEPVRGGVRVYLDDKLVAIIKRQDLDVKTAKPTANGALSWSFYDFLKAHGVDTSKVVEGWIIRDNRRKEELPASELATMSFAASSLASGAMQFGDKQLVANALALHTHQVKPEELPKILPEEDDD